MPPLGPGRTAVAWGISEPNVLKRTDRSSDIHRVATISRETDLDRLHFLIETQRLINAGASEAERVMAVVLERVQHITDADGAAVEIVDGDALVYRAVSGIAENSDGIRVDLESTLSGLCVRMGMPLLCRDTESDSRVDREACRMVAARSMAVAPLVHSGETVGVFSVFSSETDHFSNADSDVIELMAGFLAPHLSNSSKLEDEAHRALQDPVTGLPNRMILMDRLQQAVYDARRYARPFGLFVVELEGLEALSSALGRDATDAVDAPSGAVWTRPCAPGTPWPASTASSSSFCASTPTERSSRNGSALASTRCSTPSPTRSGWTAAG